METTHILNLIYEFEESKQFKLLQKYYHDEAAIAEIYARDYDYLSPDEIEKFIIKKDFLKTQLRHYAHENNVIYIESFMKHLKEIKNFIEWKYNV